MIQKSVWVYPYPCQDEMRFLKDFFGFGDHDYLLIETDSLGFHNQTLMDYFHLS